MSTIPVNLATEDQLSEAVLRRLLAHVNRGYAIGTPYGRGGFGYLRRTVHGWNRAAAGIPFVLLTDLDRSYDCPQALIDDWLSVSRHPNLIFRVAVREVESWLIADRENIAVHLSIPASVVPADVESLADPKATLINLARRSRIRSIRERIVPKARSTARQGPDYNGCLTEFVQTPWRPSVAARQCRSLSRCIQRLKTFTPCW